MGINLLVSARGYVVVIGRDPRGRHARQAFSQNRAQTPGCRFDRHHMIVSGYFFVACMTHEATQDASNPRCLDDRILAKEATPRRLAIFKPGALRSLLDKGDGLYITKRRQKDIDDTKPRCVQKIHDIHGFVEAHGLLDGVSVRHVGCKIRKSFHDRTVFVRISAPQFRAKTRGRQKNSAAWFKVMRPGVHGRDRLTVSQVMNGSLADYGVIGCMRQGFW